MEITLHNDKDSLPIWIGLLDEELCEFTMEGNYQRQLLTRGDIKFPIHKGEPKLAAYLAFYDAPQGGSMKFNIAPCIPVHHVSEGSILLLSKEMD